MEKKWILKEQYTDEFAEKLSEHNRVVLQLLFNRGLSTHEKINEFLNPNYANDILDPFLFRDMERAVERINQARDKQEKIIIHGDYDADGVTSSVLLEKSLRKIGLQNIEVFIPHRIKDGYGLNKKTVSKFIEQKANLVITVDCGVSSIEEIAILKENKIDTIITDHHIGGDKLPDAFAILDPSLEDETYPFQKLAGVGVAFKLSQALFRRQKDQVEFEAFEKWLLDLVTIGTIGDVSPIVGENRTLVKYGLMVLNKTPRKGLHELLRTASVKLGEEFKPKGTDLFDLSIYNISFQIVPRINAAGRIDHAYKAYQLLSTEDEFEAVALAGDIHRQNLDRQKIGEKIQNEALEKLGEIKDEKILIVSGNSWNHGIVGLAAGRIKDKFSRPTFVFTENEGVYKGSGRSIKEFNITKALQKNKDILASFGGHSQACGCTVEGHDNFKEFIKRISGQAEETLKDVKLIPTIEIDCQLNFSDLTWELIEQLTGFEPFAEANPCPFFLIERVHIDTLDIIGKNKTTLRFLLSQGRDSFKAIAFSKAEDWQGKFKSGDTVDIVIEFGVNEWNGNRELQVKVIDMKQSSIK
jgi:single-stranded-DNA-specific exonuclease